MRSVLSGLIDLVFAPRCLGCDGAILPTDPARLVCGRCRSRLRPLPPPRCPRCWAPRLRTGRAPGPTCGECEDWPEPLRLVRSARLLHPPADRLVYQLKYRGWRALAEPMAEWMAALPLSRAGAAGVGVVVPVPTTGARRRERGYNQAALLARAFARHTRRRVLGALERTAGAASQTVLQPAARGANVAGAFRVRAGMEGRVGGVHLLLVDDVLTTGATLAECARTLAGAGALSICAVTFARALDVRRLSGI